MAFETGNLKWVRQTPIRLCCIASLIATVAAQGAFAAPPTQPRSIRDIRGGGRRSFKLVEIPFEEIDKKQLSAEGEMVLKMDGMKWKHAQTDHFVLHYERVTFAKKVGRMAEFFYAHIGEELQTAEDRVDGRSHIFIFRNEKKWKEFQSGTGIGMEWAFSLVKGTSMYLQQANNTKDSGSILAHEMTHMVVNRLFPGRLPTWLNEGLAEWYEEFGYAAFKGTKRSKRSPFRKMKRRMPLEKLVHLSTYPTDNEEIHSFYETAKFLVGYMMLDWPSEKIVPFAEDLISGTPLTTAYRKHYGIASIAALEEGFDDFVR